MAPKQQNRTGKNSEVLGPRGVSAEKRIIRTCSEIGNKTQQSADQAAVQVARSARYVCSRSGAAMVMSRRACGRCGPPREVVRTRCKRVFAGAREGQAAYSILTATFAVYVHYVRRVICRSRNVPDVVQ